MGQMQQIRISLRGQAVVLMGKNTMMRIAIRGHMENNPNLERLLPHIKQNVGFVFTKEDLSHVRDLLLSNKVRAPAKAGALAPLDVVVPAQNTGMGPEKTSFFQALSIPTKITRGTIEIISDVNLIKTGDKVGMSEATLLNMLKISPFTYGLVVQKVYDNGSIFDPEILDISDDDLRAKFMDGVANVAAVSLGIGYPTVASAPHSLVNGMKNLLAVAAAVVVLLLGDPHLLEGGEGSQDGSSDPDGVLPLRRSNDLDLDGGGSQGSDFLLHTVSNTGVHGGASRHDGVGVQVLPDVNIALHDGVEGGLVDTTGF